MKTSSCKQKGRRCSEEVRQLLLSSGGISELDLIVTPSGVNGPDILVSEKASQEFPFAIECKNQEKISIWEALKQAEAHTKKLPLEPVLFFKRNRSKLYVALDAEFFVKNFRKKE